MLSTRSARCSAPTNTSKSTTLSERPRTGRVTPVVLEGADGDELDLSPRMGGVASTRVGRSVGGGLAVGVLGVILVDLLLGLLELVGSLP